MGEAKVIFLSRQNWVPADVDGWGDIAATTGTTNEVYLHWTEFAGQVARQRVEATGMTVDEYTAQIARIAGGD